MINAIFQSLSFNTADEWWQSSWGKSVFGRLLSSISRACPKAPTFGSYLQSRSFLGVMLLFSILALPWFVDDKDGLALVTLGCAATWFIGAIIGGKEKREAGGIDIPVWLYLASNVIATASSRYVEESRHGLLKLIVYIVAYFLFTAIFQNSGRRKYYVLGALLITAVGVVINGLYQYKMGVLPLATWEDPTVETQGVRIFSTLNNPNLLAGYLVPLAPLAAGLSIAAFFAKRRVLCAAVGAIALLLAVGTILTGSRGGFIGLFAGMGVLGVMLTIALWRANPSKGPWILVGFIGVAVISLAALHFVPAFEQRALSIIAGREHSSNSYRMYVYAAALKMFKDNWWIGVGPGNQSFVMAYGLYMSSKFDALGAYCVPLEVAVEAGVFALASFICLLVGAFSRGHLCFWLGEGDSNERWLAAASTAALVAMMAHGIVDTVFYRPQVQFVFWLLIAILATAKIKQQNSFIRDD